MPLKYLLDEHVPPLFQTQLVRRETTLTVWKVADPGAPPRGTLDPDILSWCEANDFVLVTNNRKSMPVYLTEHLAAGRHVPGILTIDLDRSMRDLLDDLLLLAMLAGIDEYQDRIEYLPL